MKCHSCNTDNNEQMRYCKNCGDPLTLTSPNVEQPTTYNPPTSKDDKFKIGDFIIGILIPVAILGLMGAASYGWVVDAVTLANEGPSEISGYVVGFGVAMAAGHLILVDILLLGISVCVISKGNQSIGKGMLVGAILPWVFLKYFDGFWL
jgi:hypothetical protein